MNNKCNKCKIATAVLAGIATALIIASFIMPPLGVIDSSVLAGVGEIFGFASLFTAWGAIDAGVSAKIERNGTSLSVGDND